MCFSAEASFVAGAALLPAGGYCVYQAIRKKPSALVLAVVPLFFGIQQISEGFVWHALEHGDTEQTRTGSLIFLFFALAVWPFWFALVAAIMEPSPPRRRWFFVLAVLTTGWFWVLYYPLLVGPDSYLQIQIVHHSIQYRFPDLAIHQYIPRPLLRSLYMVSVALPMCLGSEKWGIIPGLVLGASAVVALLVFDYAFISVWCFFGAILAGYLCYIFGRLPVVAKTT